ncbi:bifunctional nicotinamidase/pyrazinamidase [Dyella sp. M7H15-1]|uniref:bifunctional nicotinamidase/pyrazinamidase n=1 Tax=Dyella sp. M7H15-1 TaxID=2501295 RepID=UPI0010050B80|nr:bifunctional nicotinamidase/pyrazinamidase [Dyella sp. M7H15-1]QAU23054.1 bifunctional nicotinamidase/pyrazinamidase [Dyella sp. M7H15-1]
MQNHAALILVDVQPDFMPGGALACQEGDTIVPGIDRLLRRRRFKQTVATQDWHPRTHISFASTHASKSPFQQISLYGHPQTLWPDHCVQNTPGASLHPAIDWSAVDLILRKGNDPQVDSYSGFRENHGPNGNRPSTGLAGWLRERGADEVYVAGLARDVCVLWTVQDALALGFRAHVLWDLTRPVTAESDQVTREALRIAGIGIVESAEDL